jgi:Arc/MetJ family transcription regulator
MRITVDIDDNQVKIIQKITGQKKKSPALSQALGAFLREQEKKALLARVLSGQTDFSLTNEQLEAQDVYETH